MKTHTITFIVSATLFLSSPCWASEVSIPIRGYSISQEHLRYNGVLISRPVKTDEKIVAIMNQNQIRTIADYAAWLANNMVYQPESGSDQWLDPSEFLKTKRGDCEDFALLNQKVLSVLGYKSHIITLSSTRYAHAICAFEYGGKFYWFDNEKLKTSNASTLVTFARELTDQYHYTNTYELDPLSKNRNLIYTRS